MCEIAEHLEDRKVWWEDEGVSHYFLFYLVFIFVPAQMMHLYDFGQIFIQATMKKFYTAEVVLKKSVDETRREREIQSSGLFDVD